MYNFAWSVNPDSYGDALVSAGGGITTTNVVNCVQCNSGHVQFF